MGLVPQLSSRRLPQAALGPAIVLAADFSLTRLEGGVAAAAAGRARPSSSPQLSALETQATALRVLVADKSFGIRALEGKLKVCVGPSRDRHPGAGSWLVADETFRTQAFKAKLCGKAFSEALSFAKSKWTYEPI